MLRHRHVDASSDFYLFRAHAEIESGAGMLPQIAMFEDCGDVSLVRSLVLAEAGVSVYAIDCYVRIGNIIGSEIGHSLHQGSNQFEHGAFYLLLVNLLARLKPFASVMSFQAAQECHGFRRKSGKTRVHSGTSSIIKSMSGTEETFSRLAAVPSLQVSTCVPLSRHTRFGIGGPADIYAETSDVEAFIAAMSIARESGLDFVVIGGGTNLIVSDAGFRGVVLRFVAARLMAAGNRVVSGAGVVLQDLVDFTIERGLKGLETLAGIPGWVGAAVYGNAGAYGHSISERVHNVRFLDGGGVRVFNNDECAFRYRESIFKDRKGWIIFSTELLLDTADAGELRKI